MATVPKNTKRAKWAIEHATEIKCYSLSNHFAGDPLHERPMIWADNPKTWNGETYNSYRKLVEVSQAAFLANELAIRNTKLVAGENGYYTIHCHSNLWFTFKVKEEMP